MQRPPLPPFTRESALAKVQAAEDAWNSRDPQRVAQAYSDNHISVRFEYEWQHARIGLWYRTHGNEHWAFDDDGYMQRRDMSANDIPISASDRRIGCSNTQSK